LPDAEVDRMKRPEDEVDDVGTKVKQKPSEAGENVKLVEKRFIITKGKEEIEMIEPCDENKEAIPLSTPEVNRLIELARSVCASVFSGDKARLPISFQDPKSVKIAQRFLERRFRCLRRCEDGYLSRELVMKALRDASQSRKVS
jgi:hypothetical protein